MPIHYMALSVRQPDATFIASGRKTIETRTWEAQYRGALLIVSTKEPRIVSPEHGVSYPTGCALALVTLYACVPMTTEHEAAACCPWYRGAWAWLLDDIRAVKPFPVRGRLGIYPVLLDAPLEFLEPTRERTPG